MRMAEVAFHFNVDDKLGYACRLLRKALRGGRRCMVVLDGPDVATLDQALWTFAGNEFVPHATVGAPAAVVRHSPILLGEHIDGQWPADVLVNLGRAVPEGAEAFGRIVEVVSVDPQDRQMARTRWRHYTEQGHALVRHDLAAGGEA